MDTGTIIAIGVLACLGWAVPTVLMRLLPDSLRGLAIALLIAVPVLSLAGGGFFFWTYADKVGLAGVANRGAAMHFWHLGVRAALIWGPVLALTALGLGTGIERRRGERMAARDPD